MRTGQLTDGTSALKLEARNSTPARKSGRSRKIRNRKKQRKKQITQFAYLCFIMFACALTILICIRYLQLKKTIQVQTRENEGLEAELVELRGENDALEQHIRNSIDVLSLRDKAVYDYDMHLPEQGQIVWYDPEETFYMHQYRNVE